MKIRETFHYGSDKVVTDFPIERLTPFTITEALAGSLYVSVLTNPDAPKAIHALMNREEASLGWCWLEVIED